MALEDALLLDVGDHRHAVFRLAVSPLPGGLGQVDVQGHIELDGQGGAGAQDLGGAGVGRVRRDRGHDQRVVLSSLQELARRGQRLLVGGGVRRREFQHGLAATPPRMPASAVAWATLILEVVHVGEAGDAGADHLGAGQLGAQAHEIRRDELALHRHHVAQQPHVQAQVVGQAAQQGHGRVGVGVDQPGHQHPAAAVDHLERLEIALATRFRGRPRRCCLRAPPPRRVRTGSATRP